MNDALRGNLIELLMCHFELSVGALEQAFPIMFANYFAPELREAARRKAIQRQRESRLPQLPALKNTWRNSA